MIGSQWACGVLARDPEEASEAPWRGLPALICMRGDGGVALPGDLAAPGANKCRGVAQPCRPGASRTMWSHWSSLQVLGTCEPRGWAGEGPVCPQRSDGGPKGGRKSSFFFRAPAALFSRPGCRPPPGTSRVCLLVGRQPLNNGVDGFSGIADPGGHPVPRLSTASAVPLRRALGVPAPGSPAVSRV